jgi:hypothetical protein
MRAAPTVSLTALSQPIISQAAGIAGLNRLIAWLRALRSAREKIAATSRR